MEEHARQIIVREHRRRQGQAASARRWLRRQAAAGTCLHARISPGSKGAPRLQDAPRFPVSCGDVKPATRRSGGKVAFAAAAHSQHNQWPVQRSHQCSAAAAVTRSTLEGGSPVFSAVPCRSSTLLGSSAWLSCSADASMPTTRSKRCASARVAYPLPLPRSTANPSRGSCA